MPERIDSTADTAGFPFFGPSGPPISLPSTGYHYPGRDIASVIANRVPNVDYAALQAILDSKNKLVLPWVPGSFGYEAFRGDGHIRDAQGNFAWLIITRDPTTGVYGYHDDFRSYFELEKSGFLGGLFGGTGGGILGAIFASAVCGPGAPACAAGFVAASAGLGTITGAGAEALITSTPFDTGAVLKTAAITAATAGVAQGVAGALGPTTTFVDGAALAPGVLGPVAPVAVTTPGIVSAQSAQALSALSSGVTKLTLDSFTATDASLSSMTRAQTPQNTAGPSLPLSGGAVNTTGATWINTNTVDVPGYQPVGLFDSILDAILPPFMSPNDLGKVDTPGGFAPVLGENQAGAVVGALIIILGGAAAFAYARR